VIEGEGLGGFARRVPEQRLCGEVVPSTYFFATQIAMDLGAKVMHLSNESLLVIIFVGIVAGWLVGRVMEGGGSETGTTLRSCG
jgi:hypothetical protein